LNDFCREPAAWKLWIFRFECYFKEYACVVAGTIEGLP